MLQYQKGGKSMKVKIAKPPYNGYNSDLRERLKEIYETGELFEVNLEKIYTDRVLLLPNKLISSSSIYIYDKDLEIIIDDVRDGLMRCEACGDTFNLQCPCGSIEGYLIRQNSTRNAFFMDKEIPILLKNKLWN